ncbi:MAG: hypothetical protein DRP27_02695 [Thermotogae bacterium]|nr:MAG: hypothetical protein DRP27_02695 [Thermotogota bacterium]
MDQELLRTSVEYLFKQGLTVYIKQSKHEFGKRGDPADLLIQDKFGADSVIEVYGIPQDLDLGLLMSLKMLLERCVGSVDKVKDEQRLLAQLISNMGSADSDPKSVAESMQVELLKTVGADAAAFFLFEETNPDRLICISAKGGAEGKIEGKEIPIEGSLAGLAYQTNQPILIADTISHPKHYHGFDIYYKTENIVAIPIKGKYKILGVVELVNKPKGFSIEDLVLLTQLASTAGIILENAIVQHQFEVLLEDALAALVEALNSRTKGAQQHSQRVRELSTKLGKCLGLDGEELKSLGLAALIFDVGKIGVSDKILNKTSSLTPEEYEEVKKHVFHGAEILSQVEEIPQQVIDAVLHHHERWNGGGYPEGLSKTEIPLFARIIGIADVFCALTEDRPYRRAMAKAEAMDYTKRESGRLFDPDLVRCLEEVERG